MGRMTLIGLALGAALAASSAAAQTPDFWKGKQLKIVVGTGAGQDYDLWARLIGKHMVKYLPGQPSFVAENMPGGGHLIATNWLYNIAPRDGTVLGVVSRNMSDAATLKMANVRFDPQKFNWIGSPEFNNRVLFIATSTGVTNARELFDKEIVVGATGAGQAVTTAPILIRNVLGMKLKIVLGYAAPEPIVLAMRRGEVGGLVETVGGPNSARREWIKSGLMRAMFSMERQKVDWLEAPTLYEFTKTREQEEVFDFFASNMLLGRPVMAPPGVPEDRVEALRRAFDSTMKDGEFLREAGVLGFEVRPQTGEDVARRVAESVKTPQAVIDRTQKGATLE